MGSGYKLKLSDETDSIEYALLEVPLVVNERTNKRRLVTKNGRIATYWSYLKRVIKHRWAYMSDEDYRRLRELYERQLTTGQYPKLTIEKLGIVEMAVVMELSERKIVRNDGLSSDVEVVFEEAN